MQRNTLKVGIMDEERRTTSNLKALQSKAASERCLAFITPVSFDPQTRVTRIHTSMEAGPFNRKGDIKGAVWIGGLRK